MANVTLLTGGWSAVPGASSVKAFARRTWAGQPPQPGTRPPTDPALLVAEATVDQYGFAALSVPESTPFYLADPSGRRWVSARSEKADISAESERAEGVEAVLAQQVEVLREEVANASVGTSGLGRLIFGINSNRAAGHAADWTASRIFGDRSNELDVGWVETPSEVSAAVGRSLAVGCKNPLLIFNCQDSAALYLIPVQEYAEKVVKIIERVIADHPTVTTFQLINEPYYKGSVPHGTKIGSNGATYGAIVNRTYELAKAAGLLPGVTLLVEAFGEYNRLTDESTQAQSGVFGRWIDDVCSAMQTPYGMVCGYSDTSTPAVPDQVSVERQEVFGFTARKAGPVTELAFRTNGNANTGVSSVKLGIMADSAGKPGAILGTGTANGEPQTNSWVTVSLGATVNLTLGTKYWLAVLPLGTAGKALHYNASQPETAGSAEVESPVGKTPKVITEYAAGEWVVFNQGPAAFMAGTELSKPMFAEINGWSNHPYGNLGAANGEGNFNWGSTEGFRTRVSTVGAGGNANWWLTEWGWQGDAEQTANMAGFLAKAQAAREAGWLTAIYAYDDGDGAWTLYNKPAGQTYKAFAKSHG